MSERSLQLRPLLLLLLIAACSISAFRLRSPQTSKHASVATPARPQSLLPDPRFTPGAIDPRITQSNITSTICRAGYTRTVRPSFQISNKLKHQVMSLYRSPGSIHDYELDHLIPLELGGCPTCISNLWPQPWTPPGAHEKDEVEDYLRDRVCHR